MDSKDEFNPYRPPDTAAAEPSPGDPAPHAPRGERFSAWLSDWLLVGLALLLGTWLSDHAWPYRSSASPVEQVARWLPLITLLAANLWLLYRGGQSVGKWNRGIRVVRQDGARAGLPRIVLLRFGVPTGLIGALVLAGMPLLALLFFTVDALFIYGATARCLHDRLANTKVVES